MWRYICDIIYYITERRFRQEPMRTCAQMPYHAGIVLRLYPSREQRRIIAVNDGCRRAVYNCLVAMNNERYLLSKTAHLVPAYRDRLCFLDSILNNKAVPLPRAMKNRMPFLYGQDIDSLTVDNAIKNYRAAWNKFREDPRAGIPTFHRKGYKQSYQTNAHYHKDAEGINDGNVRFLNTNHITLPILGTVRIRGSRKRLLAIMNRKDTRIGTITIRKDAVGRYFVSLQLASEYPFADTLPHSGAVVGIDLNIDNFLWDSNNKVVNNPKFRRNEQQNIARLQRAMCRKKEQAKKDGRPLSSCKNYQKDRIALARLHSRIAGRANDFRHVIAKEYVENQDYIFAEDLKVRNLLKNHKLAMAISECGWSDFLKKLKVKSSLYGRTFILVPPHHTTQTCSSCGHVLTDVDRLTLGDREWVCPECGAYHVRDYNAAKNVLARGLATLGLTPV